MNNNKKVLLEDVYKTLDVLGVDDIGMDEIDRTILRAIAEKFGGGPVGVKTLAASLSEEEATIEDVYEPFLLQRGFIERTSQGRKLTKNGAVYLGVSFEGSPKQELF